MPIDAELHARMEAEFEKSLDEYMGEWEASLRERCATGEKRLASPLRKRLSSLRKSKDASGHEHDKLGQFTAGAGGSAAGSSAGTEASAKLGQSAAKPDPMRGHPLAGKGAEEIIAVIRKASGVPQGGTLAQATNPNPLGYNEKTFPKGVDGPKLTQAVVQAVTEQKQRNPFARLTLPQLYAKAKEVQPNLSAWDFQNALAKMHTDGQIFLGAWTQALIGIPEPQMAMPLAREMKYYAEPPRK